MDNIEQFENQIYNTDCFDILKNIPDNSIDMVLTDPPYNMTNNKWDIKIDYKLLFNELNRIIKSNGCIAMFAQPPFNIVLANANIKYYKYDWIWVKNIPVGFLNANRKPLNLFENIMIFYKKLPTYNPQMRTGFKPYKTCKSGNAKNNYNHFNRNHITISNGDRYPINILNFNKDTNKLHPTQKPQKLLEYLIKTYTKLDEIVLDCFAGSGSTGAACVNTERKYILIEKETKYFDIIQNRLFPKNELLSNIK